MTNYALITVYDKSNLKKICSIFKKYKIKIISSGTTGNYIRKLGFKCDDLSIQKKIKEKFNISANELEIFTALRKWKDNF